ncbi:MAG: hypothetical protein NZ744_14600 [Pirellulaceae bacterium]|nr:hypothetical protein [Pirellulaceae bacterium]
MSSIATTPTDSTTSTLFTAVRRGGMFAMALFAILAQAALITRHPAGTVALNPSFLYATLAGILCINGCIRLCTFTPRNTQASWLSRIVWITPSIISVETFILISNTTLSSSLVVMTGLFLVVVECNWWIVSLSRESSKRPQQTTIIKQQLLFDAIDTPAVEATILPLDDTIETATTLLTHAQQSWTRFSDESGESITAIERVLFESGQRHQTIHFSFVPSLIAIPEITTHIVEGPPASIRLDEIQTFGARLELKLSQKYEEPVELIIQIEMVAVRTVAA